MNLLSAENLSKSYGERTLFSGLNLGINQGQKVALIARNGTGKSTLLNILAGREQPDTGQVTYRKGLRRSYLEQHPHLDPELTVGQTLFATGNELVQILARYELALANPGDTAGYQRAFEAMERANAWDLETRFNQILSRLQLNDPEQPVRELSGGQRRRVALAHCLIESPELLILDEPTNHLDLEMIEWLEGYFANEPVSLLMVTHDRYFLDQVCNDILELSNGTLHPYPGNYQEYLREKASRQEIGEVTAQKTRSLYRKELEWMRRQPRARTTKSKSRIEDFEAIKKEALGHRQQREIELEINMERLGTKVVELHNVSKHFGDRTLFEGFTYHFKRGERVGLIGRNGSGKSTLLNLVVGSVMPDTGKVVRGDTLQVGYYTQRGLEAEPGTRVIDVVREFGDYIPLKKGRQLSAQQLLERFLFDRKAQYDYIEKLSGGERKRLFLCTVLIRNPNFLILDEPTNDLDIDTLAILEDFLLDFPGTLLVVSHDRFFMDKITDHLFVFDGVGGITDFPGNYTDYRISEAASAQAGPKDSAASGNPVGRSQGKAVEPAGPGTRLPKEEHPGPRKGKRTYAQQREFEKLEREIAALEERKGEIASGFSDPENDGEVLDALSREMAGLLEDLENKTGRWFELAAIEEGT